MSELEYDAIHHKGYELGKVAALEELALKFKKAAGERVCGWSCYRNRNRAGILGRGCRL